MPCPSFLQTGYDVTVGHRRYESTFFEISDGIRRIEGPRNIVYKAVYHTDSHFRIEQHHSARYLYPRVNHGAL